MGLTLLLWMKLEDLMREASGKAVRLVHCLGIERLEMNKCRELKKELGYWL